MKDRTGTSTYAQMGMAALLPGMQYMLERMQKELGAMREMLGALQHEPENDEHRPPIAASGAWANLTAEERSIEMKRRMKVRDEKRAAKLNPRNKDHPDHAQWATKVARKRKRAWDAQSPAKKKARVAAMAAGRVKAARRRKVNGTAGSMENVA